ncbi:MAG: hypothetical protein AAGJ93_00080 [Bacteroidota bacterium]
MLRIYTILFFSILLIGCAESSGDIAAEASGSTGQGGSLARFTIIGNYLYTLESDALQWFEIAADGKLTQKGELQLNEGKETIFPLDNLLFLGATDGLSIFQVEAEGEPVFQSEIEHFVGCDPVVADDEFAYVTLRLESCPGVFRNNTIDVLNIYDVTDITNPQEIASYPMNDPRGLGLAGDILFVGQGANGMVIMDVTDPLDVQTITTLEDVHVNDVIVLPEVLLVIGPEKIVQFDYSDPTNLVKLSEIGI